MIGLMGRHLHVYGGMLSIANHPDLWFEELIFSQGTPYMKFVEIEPDPKYVQEYVPEPEAPESEIQNARTREDLTCPE